MLNEILRTLMQVKLGNMWKKNCHPAQYRNWQASVIASMKQVTFHFDIRENRKVQQQKDLEMQQ